MPRTRPSLSAYEAEVAVAVRGVTVPGGRAAFEAHARAIGRAMARYVRRSVDLSVALVGDPEMHALNRAFLDHDYPTDVLSFPLSDTPLLTGEVICSVDTARREATQRGHAAADELSLYVVHGCLHLVGYDDHSPADRRRMRAAERRWLASLGVRAAFGPSRR